MKISDLIEALINAKSNTNESSQRDIEEIAMPAILIVQKALNDACQSEDPGVVNVIEYPDPRDHRLSPIREVSYTEAGEALAIVVDCLSELVTNIERVDSDLYGVRVVHESIEDTLEALYRLPECMEVIGGDRKH